MTGADLLGEAAERSQHLQRSLMLAGQGGKNVKKYVGVIVVKGDPTSESRLHPPISGPLPRYVGR